MSELAKPTEGPWRVDATKATGPMGVYSDTAEQELSGICWFSFARDAVNGKRQTRETIEANARLISAAPDLLSACLSAVLVYDVMVSDGIDDTPIPEQLFVERDALKAAIAKATGSEAAR